ncbi:MAG: hypothetical protein KDC98_26545, partial [Planctomycetes bacterium]|nr:hypothetical protein [Planctomycetota bacterium]
MASPRDIIALYKAKRSERSVLDTELQAITDYVLPYGVNVTDTTSPGARRGARRYDSTAADSAELLAAALSDTITNPAQTWMGWEFGVDELNENLEAREWLEAATDEHMSTLDDSNFYTQADEAWIGLVSYGTDAMYEEELPRDRDGAFTGVTFQAWPISEYVFTEDANGEANGAIRCFQLTAAAARRKFSQMPRYQGLGRK